MAVCPKCHRVLPQVGDVCPDDGWYSIAEEELNPNDHILGYPISGKFVALKRIGQGGMGVVYLGRQIGLERIVAIKILSQIQQSNEIIAKRFQREAKSIARIIHPNVVQLIDAGIEDDIAYIIMEYVQGRELSSLPAKELSGQVIAHITHQILSALSEAHNCNVIHRDLKPDNIMITVEDDDKYFVKVLDFGLASLTDGAKITISGQALGTPWYMSPEQATAVPVTYTTDFYSLGCILYELVSGKPPFSGNRPFNVMMQHVNAEIPLLIPRPEVEVSSAFTAFIYRCLQKKSADRYQTAIEALNALHACPEWGAAGQFDSLHSISLVMKQLVEMNDKSDPNQGIQSPPTSSTDNQVLSSRSNSIRRSDLNAAVDNENNQVNHASDASDSLSKSFSKLLAEPSSPSNHSIPANRPSVESLTTNLKTGGSTRQNLSDVIAATKSYEEMPSPIVRKSIPITEPIQPPPQAPVKQKNKLIRYFQSNFFLNAAVCILSVILIILIILVILNST